MSFLNINRVRSQYHIGSKRNSLQSKKIASSDLFKQQTGKGMEVSDMRSKRKMLEEQLSGRMAKEDLKIPNAISINILSKQKRSRK